MQNISKRFRLRLNSEFFYSDITAGNITCVNKYLNYCKLFTFEWILLDDNSRSTGRLYNKDLKNEKPPLLIILK